MKHPFSVVSLALLAAISSVSCDKLRPPMPELQKPAATADQAGPQEGERTAFAQAAQKELDELKVTITEFKAKAEASGAETKARLAEEVKKLDADMGEAQARLAAVKTATLASWSEMKETFSRSLDKLKTGVEHFRKSAA